MARLFRPHIPLSVRCTVAARQLGWPDARFLMDTWFHCDTFGKALPRFLQALADKLGCEPADLRLDHDPALCNRQRLQYSSVVKPTYIPDANDPEHMIYRTHVAHDIKTRIRGDGAQHSDLALRRKMKQIERKREGGKLSTSRLAKSPKRRNKRPWPKRPNSWPKRG